jgi:hypothetical protein
MSLEQRILEKLEKLDKDILIKCLHIMRKQNRRNILIIIIK